MKKFLFIPIVLLALLSSCTSSSSIDINMYGGKDSTAIVVSKLAVNKLKAVDTLYLKKGHADISLKVNENSPEFIYLESENGKRVSVLLSKGENVSVELDSNGELLNIQGSPESLLLQEVEAAQQTFRMAFDSLSVALNNAVELGDQAARTRINKELGAMYVAYKQKAIKYIYAHPKSMTLIPVIFHNVAENLPLFSEYSDAILFERVYDSLRTKFSGSPYLVSLMSEIEKRKNLLQVETFLSNAERTDFPEIILPDVNSQQQHLSALQGNVILLSFWDPQNDGMKLYNNDLIPIYEKYHSKGFQIYQVAITSDKTDWAIYLKGKPLPWISVCDIANDNSYAAAVYNVSELPSLFLIAKDGTIVSKNIFDIKALEKEIAKLVSAK
ncbi:MAG: TlpA family protein disulfide reductase [Bacteroidales bacterium]|nr:TlpA family protein disulfide reductase [Bacteroidales bacterium]MBO7322687.1 TlpA family protein disulfide reductase [Bacteroidales bacterium]